MNFRFLFSATLLASVSFSSHANLSISDGGLGVYDSVLNVTWTSDANLLGTMENNPTAYGFSSASDLISAIISDAGGTISDMPNGLDKPSKNPGSYTLSSGDFGSEGSVNWWGAEAFVNFLNTINYGNSSNWTLPSTVDSGSSYNTPPAATSSQLAELIYGELGGVYGSSIPGNANFTNEQSTGYWSGTEYSANPTLAWGVTTSSDWQYGHYKANQNYAWAVSYGNITAPVPLPGGIWLFGSAFAGFIGFNRRKSKP
jgi:hypothetical protein